MKWYYVDQGQQAGPVDDAQLEQLRSNGKIQLDTLVWQEGMANWMPYREAIPSATRPPPAPAAAPIIVASDASSSGPAPGAITQAGLLARDYEVDIGGPVSRAWELLKANAGILIGASALVYIVMFAMNVIPYLGIVLALFFTGPLMGGLWLLYIKAIRNQSPTVGDAFGGFGPKFWQLMLVQLIPTLVALGFAVVVAIVAALALPALAAAKRGSESASAIGPVLLIVLGVVVLIFMVVMTYLNVCWMFAMPLAADKGLRFWPALELSRRVVNKHWWMTFLLAVVCGMIAMSGILACGIGLLATMPLGFAGIVYHYEKVFGDLAVEA
jgi:hypothetical protein